MARFYSVQSPADASRLAAGGEPWPTSMQRANLGPGFYAWAAQQEAERYQAVLENVHGLSALRIVIYEVPEEKIATMKKMDLTLLTDSQANAWMERHSQYGLAEPHGYEYVLRASDKGREHYFAATVFGQFREVKVQ